MDVFVSDVNAVPGVDATLFQMVQQSPVAALATLTNTGTNTMNYHWQQFDGNVWSDMDSLGTPLNNTLSAYQTVAISVSSSYPQVRLNGYGNTVLLFAIDRYFERMPGGVIPIINL